MRLAYDLRRRLLFCWHDHRRVGVYWLGIWLPLAALVGLLVNPPSHSFRQAFWHPGVWVAIGPAAGVIAWAWDRFFVAPPVATLWAKRLTSKDGDIRETAERELCARGPGAIDLLLPALRAEGRQALLWMGVVSLCVLVFALSAASAWRSHGLRVSDFGGFLYATMAILGLVGGSQFRRSATTILARLNDRRAIGPLLEARGYWYVRGTADASLVRLLPTLKATDALSSSDHAHLGKALLRGGERFVQAALQALAQIGDERDVAALEQLAHTGGRTHTPEILRAARECLASVRERIELAQAQRTLLRPSAAPDSDGTLLRPAAGVETPDLLLLRPAAGDSAESPAIEATGRIPRG